MRTTLFMVALISIVSSGHGQANCLRTIEFEVLKTINYNYISDGSSTAGDYASFRPFSTSYRKESCVNGMGEIESHKYFDAPAFNADDWATPIYRISNYNGRIDLYGQAGELISSISPNHELTNYNPLTSEEITWFGIEETVVLPAPEDIQIMEDEGMLVFELDEDEILIKSDSMEWLLNSSKQILQSKTFRNGTLTRKEVLKVQPFNDSMAVPIYRTVSDYRDRNNGDVLETIEHLKYFNYEINNELIGELQNDSNVPTQAMGLGSLISKDILLSDIELKINPNPAGDHIEVRLPFPSVERSLLVEVMDLVGNVLYSDDSHLGGHRMQIQIADWPKGVYIVTCSHEGHRVQKRFIKK